MVKYIVATERKATEYTTFPEAKEALRKEIRLGNCKAILKSVDENGNEYTFDTRAGSFYYYLLL